MPIKGMYKYFPVNNILKLGLPPMLYTSPIRKPLSPLPLPN